MVHPRGVWRAPYNVGGRPVLVSNDEAGELQDLAIVTDHDYGTQVTVEGKQGRRSPVLVQAPQRVEKWVQMHPAPDDPTALRRAR